MSKLERRKTPRDTDRFKALQARLDWMVKEMHDIRAQIEDVTTRDPMAILRERWQSEPDLAGEGPPRSGSSKRKKPHS